MFGAVFEAFRVSERSRNAGSELRGSHCITHSELQRVKEQDRHITTATRTACVSESTRLLDYKKETRSSK
jgi:hypothetical protein